MLVILLAKEAPTFTQVSKKVFNVCLRYSSFGYHSDKPKICMTFKVDGLRSYSYNLVSNAMKLKFWWQQCAVILSLFQSKAAE